MVKIMYFYFRVLAEGSIFSKQLQLETCYSHFYDGVFLQNLPYGNNGNYVDVYLPPNTSSPRPVIVFIFGGTWGSGDKNMYGLLCSELARSLSSVVLCPNYSIYPKVCMNDFAVFIQ
jgi:acetyl esterase/lipase